MSSSAGAPETARIFVGNLVPSITNVALLRLFSRFGDVFELERNSEKGFAHLSLKRRGNKLVDITRCVSSLHKTSWLGTTLRVERARENFLARLRREWAEERSQESEEMEVASDMPRGEHFANFKKGMHTRFSFPDLDPLKSSPEDRTEEDLDKGNMDKLSSSPVLPNVSDANLENRSPAKSEKLDSTLALFGLYSTSVEGPRDAGSVHERKRSGAPRQQSPAKRPRSTVRIEEDAEEPKQEPSIIDINSERQAARNVLQKLFPEAHLALSGSVSCRRLGLYRKLIQTTDVESSYVEDGDQGREESHYYVAEPCRPDKAVAVSSVAAFRRAGLYRMLQNQAPT